MADNIPIKDAAGNTRQVATKNVGGADYQRNQPVWGDSGTVLDVSLANPQPVQDAVARTTLAQIAASLASGLIINGGLSIDTTGLATAANQATENTSIAQLHTDLSSVLSALGLHATETTLAAVRNALTTLNGAVSTAALQTTGNGKLDAINNALAGVASQTTLGQVLAAVNLLHTDNGAQATAALQATGNTSLASLVTALSTLNATVAGPLTVRDAGTFNFAPVTGAGNVDVPLGARIREVSWIASSAGSASMTVTSLGKTITVPASEPYTLTVVGDLLGTSATNDIVFAGNVASGTVTWTV